MTTRVVFPSFRDNEYTAFEMRQLVSALELRFQSLESNVEGFYPTQDEDDFSRVGHTHVESEITNLNHTTSIFELDDVIGTPDPSDVLAWNGSAFEPVPPSGASSLELDDLLDVNAPGPADGQALVWDISTLRWIPGDAPVGIDTLFDLTDTDLVGQQEGDILFNADGTEWQATGNNFQWIDSQYIQLGNNIGVNWYDADFSSVELVNFFAGPVDGYNLGTLADSVFVEDTDDSTFSFAQEHRAVWIKPDGTRIFTTNGSDRRIHEHRLDTAWDLSSLSNSGNPIASSAQLSVVAQDTGYGLAFDPTGTIFFYLANSATGAQGTSKAYLASETISPAWDVSAMEGDQKVGGWEKSLDVDAAGIDRGDGLFVSHDGRYLTVLGRTHTSGNKVIQAWEMTTPWDLDTAVLSGTSRDMSTFQQSAIAAIVSDDGLRVWLLEGSQGTTRDVIEYALSSAWDMSSMSSTSTSSYTLNATTVSTEFCTDLFWAPDRDEWYAFYYGRATQNDGFLEKYSLASVGVTSDRLYLGDPAYSTQIDGTLISLKNNIGINWDDADLSSVELLNFTATGAGSGSYCYGVGLAADPLWDDVTCLLPFEGTDGATTTTDESATGATPTFNGTAQIDTAQFACGTSSLLLDGNSDTVTFPVNNAAYEVNGNVAGGRDTTIEFFFRWDGANPTADRTIANYGGESGVRFPNWLVGLNTSNQLYCVLSDAGNAPGFVTHNITDTTTTILADTWYYITVEFKNGDNDLFLYVDGVQTASETGAGNRPETQYGSAELSIGNQGGTTQWFGGHVDGFRITQNQQRYAGTHSIPSTIFTSQFVAGDPGYNTQIDGTTTTVTGDFQVDGISTFLDYINGTANFGDPGTELGSISVNDTVYESVVKISDFGGDNEAMLHLHRHSDTLTPIIVGSRSRGNTSTHVDVLDNDILLSIISSGWNTDTYNISSEIQMRVDGTPSATAMPGEIALMTAPSGTRAAVDNLVVRADGKIDISDDINFADILGDRITMFGTPDDAGNYSIGIESGTVYAKSGINHRWYINTAPDGGTSDVMELTSTDMTVNLDLNVFGATHTINGNLITFRDVATNIFAEFDQLGPASSDRMQINVPVALQNGVTNRPVLYMQEIADAVTDFAAFGQWWVHNDTPNTPWFTDDAGGDSQLARLAFDDTVTGDWSFSDQLTIVNGTDTALFRHNGTDFLTTFTATADWDITGLTGEVFVDADLRTSGDLTVGGTTTTINSNTVSIADNIILLNSDEAGAPTQNAGFEVERGTSANVSLLWNETTDVWFVANPFAFDGGSAGAPGITWVGDENTGFYQPSPPGFGVSIDGTNTMNWQATYTQSVVEFWSQQAVSVNNTVSDVGQTGVFGFMDVVSATTVRVGAYNYDVGPGWEPIILQGGATVDINASDSGGIIALQTTNSDRFVINSPNNRFEFNDYTIFMEERAAAVADVAAYGQLWVRNDVPNRLFFTDDAGTDWDILNLGGGGALPSGVATNDSLRWNGSAWVAESDFNITAAGTINAVGINATADITVTSASADVRLLETGATVDEGNWIIRANTDTFRIQTASDAAPNTGAENAYTIARTGTAPAAHTFNGSSYQFQVNSIGDFLIDRQSATLSSGIGFQNDDGTKGYIGFSDDERFNIWDSGTTSRFQIDPTPADSVDFSTTRGRFDFVDPILVNTASDTLPFYVSRTGNTANEVMQMGLTDTIARIEYLNDEISGSIRLNLNNSDTETGGGAGANTHINALFGSDTISYFDQVAGAAQSVQHRMRNNAYGAIFALDGAGGGFQIQQTNAGATLEDIWISMVRDGGVQLRYNNVAQVSTGALGTQMDLPIFMFERAAAQTDAAAFGQIWVRNDVPNTLMFTDDAGVDHDLTATGGGTIGGSITDNQIAVGAATADDIEGSANLTWNGADFNVVGQVFADSIGSAGNADASAAFSSSSGTGVSVGSYVTLSRLFSSARTALGNNVYCDPNDAVSGQMRYAVTHPSYGHTIYEMAAGDHFWYGDSASVTAGNVVTKNALAQLRLEGFDFLEGVGTTGAPGTDQLRMNGYGIAGNRASTVYLTNTNASGAVQINAGGIHGSANSVATFTTNGASITDGKFLRVEDSLGTDFIEIAHNDTLAIIATSGTGSGAEPIRIDPGSGNYVEIGGGGANSIELRISDGDSTDYTDIYNNGTDTFFDQTGGGNMDFRQGTTRMASFQTNNCLFYNNGVLQIQTADNDATGVSSGGLVKNHAGTLLDIGFNELQTFSMNASDTLEARHQGAITGKHGVSTAYTLTLAAASDTDFQVAGSVQIMNGFTSGNYTINEGASTTLYYLDGTTRVDTAGGCTLGPGGVATIYRYAAGIYYIWGSGITP